MRLRATITFEYEADPEFYGTTDPEEMVNIDRRAFADGSGDLMLDLFYENGGTVAVEPVVE